MNKYKPMKQSEPQPIVIDKFGGVDFSSNPTQVALNRSPDALNMILDEKGFPSKRTGKDLALASLGTGKIQGLMQVGDKVLVAHGGYIYEYDASELNTNKTANLWDDSDNWDDDADWDDSTITSV